MELLPIQEFAKMTLEDDTTGHNWKHALRVEKNAKKISPDELDAEDIEIIRSACWLHDTIDDKISDSKRKSIADVAKLLNENDATKEQKREILYIIQNLSYSKNLEEKQELNHLGQIVQDADRLDALGAIGIARTFYYGGHKGNPIYDEERPRRQEELTEANYRDQTSVVNHFFEKLLLLEETMNTTPGKTEAIKRTKLMREFLETFFKEVFED